MLSLKEHLCCSKFQEILQWWSHLLTISIITLEGKANKDKPFKALAECRSSNKPSLGFLVPQTIYLSALSFVLGGRQQILPPGLCLRDRLFSLERLGNGAVQLLFQVFQLVS